jgi:hypothetical protein
MKLHAAARRCAQSHAAARRVVQCNEERENTLILKLLYELKYKIDR